MLHKFKVVLQTQQGGLFFVCTAIVEQLSAVAGCQVLLWWVVEPFVIDLLAIRKRRNIWFTGVGVQLRKINVHKCYL